MPRVITLVSELRDRAFTLADRLRLLMRLYKYSLMILFIFSLRMTGHHRKHEHTTRVQ